MRSLNKASQKIMDKLTTGVDAGCPHRRIDNTNKAFMPVVIEVIGKAQLDEAIGTLYSIAHYYKQNGDAMRDPEMVFYKAPDGKYYPVMFQQDNLCIYQESVEWEGEKIVAYDRSVQKDHVFFANLWMKNIKEQQEIC